MTLEEEEREIGSVLDAAWKRLPDLARGPTQFLGRQYAGCGATIGAMPKCDFACTGCYLNKEANRVRPRSVPEIKQQLDQIRAWLGPGGNVQITDGEVSLRDEREVTEMIRYAREIGLVPMLMTQGETFRRRSGLLERLMERGGLSEISIHVDSTQRGRRDHFANARTEEELHELRGEFASMIRLARERTGQRLEVASTVTVTRDNLREVPEIIRWFLTHADAFKMVSFQPLAEVGRTDPALRGVHPDELWDCISEGAGNPEIRNGEGWLGHPDCSRFVQGLAMRESSGPRFEVLYDRNNPAEMAVLSELLDRLGGMSFRLDDRPKVIRRLARIASRHGWFVITRLLPRVLKLLSRVRSVRANYFCIVSHHFMSRDELETPRGQERLDACAFKVPVNGRLEAMCSVNALGLRESFYAETETKDLALL